MTPTFVFSDSVRTFHSIIRTSMAQASSEETAFESRLTDGTDRFLAHAIEHSFTIGRRTSRDFLRHFPPSTIMEALKDSPTLRADILEVATGMRRKVALKKSAASSGEDLQIALEEGEAAPDEVIQLFRPDDRVRFLPRGKLWAFVIEGEFWKVSKTEKGVYERAQAHVAFLLDRAIKDRVLSHQDVIDGITVGKLCQLMPRPELETALNSALAVGRSGKSFSDRDLYESLSSTTIVNYIPLAHVWDEVINPFVAVEHGLAEALNAVARGEPAPGAEEPDAQAAENSNGQAPAPQAPAQARPAPARMASPAPALKRAQAPATAKAAAPARASLPAVEPVETLAEDEEEAFDVHFDNLTATNR